ncbi:5-hydroxytryptamine receptor 3A-like [Hyperolius riggenbachi]|uniref:5-hydroxytryptamine receptor 3A-like n=1 Tax=Hyperolius riggenbachi TaxID=752182 RepID=UPI0035A27D52
MEHVPWDVCETCDTHRSQRTSGVATEKTSEISYTYVTHEGKIFNGRPMQLVTVCNLNIYYFPFDQQNCTLTFGSWMHTMEDVTVDFLNNVSSLEVPESYYDNDGEWDLVKAFTKRQEFLDDGVMRFSETKYFIVIKRRSTFYVINLILPSMFLIFMDIVGFYLPPESGERVSFKITLLLGYSVFLIIASDQLPANGTALIGVYFIICLIMMVISIMESILMVRIIHSQNLYPTVPKWLKKLVFGKMSLLVCLKSWVQFVAPREDSSEMDDQTQSSTEKLEIYEKDNISYDKPLSMNRDQELLLSIRNEVVSIQKHLKKQDHETITMEWLQIGYVVDKFLFRAYLIVLFVLSVSLGSIWAQWYRQ